MMWLRLNKINLSFVIRGSLRFTMRQESIYITAVFLISTAVFTNGFVLDTITNMVQVIPKPVCYGDLGCFHSDVPFLSVHRPITVSPQSPAEIGTDFLLFTRETPNQNNKEHLNVSNPTSFHHSHFNGRRSTKIIVHGFLNNAQEPWVQAMTTELLKKGDYNVITVDWHRGAAIPYRHATANTRVVGAQIAQLITRLTQHADTTIDKFHIIGHSLGAHIAGYAGERLTHLPRITGLDPASPYFENSETVVRLDPSDADFVDIIHTDGGGLSDLGLGYSGPLGHVDFYPNGGREQPGCPSNAVDKLGQTSIALGTMFDLYAASAAMGCSHGRACDLFTESINTACPFLAFPCGNEDDFNSGKCSRCHGLGCSHMGFNSDRTAGRGTMYLNTESHTPFCDYHYLLNISSANMFEGELSITLTGELGTSGPIQLMNANEYHGPHTPVSKWFSVPVHLGTVTSVTLHYEKMDTVLLNNMYPDNWRLNSMTLFSAEMNLSESFCASHKIVSDHHSTTFGLTGSC